MNKRELGILERAYSSEINGALHGCSNILQTKSKVAQQLAEDGLLRHTRQFTGNCFIEGYELTHAGRLAYCVTCSDEEPDQ